MLVQIYGVTTPEDAALVNSLRPDHVGVVLDEGIGTWDLVDHDTMRAILAELTDVSVVALSLSTSHRRIVETVAAVSPAVLHLARAVGSLDADSLAALRAEITPVKLMVTIPVLGPEAVDVASALDPVSDFLLLDTAHPQTGVVGATGFVHDWSISQAIVDAVDTPVILAGGLGPDNVDEAIRAVRPYGVDSETRTSRSDDRRRKDPEKLRLFIERARAAR
ncbi:MAG TPA: phosphoribosylanthranilate isomerase [Acidimicrobiales bacterium]|nr:phosphoribosylanthranilate isomerase [Acidimicrobiales bacterium]